MRHLRDLVACAAIVCFEISNAQTDFTADVKAKAEVRRAEQQAVLRRMSEKLDGDYEFGKRVRQVEQRAREARLRRYGEP